MSSKEEIIEQLTRLVEENLDNERFGVEELSAAFSMSRSTLLRTVKKHTGLSANEFIKDVRLERSRLMLSETEKTISEISYEIGFSSPSYFIKCYKAKYGESPGGSRQSDQIVLQSPGQPSNRLSLSRVLIGAGSLVLIAAVIYWFSRPAIPVQHFGKSIAVLPFKNESADSTNVYFVNGMMESILNNLQKIEDIRVISRTSVEQYRNMKMSTPEIAVDLGVDYILEGSGQKLGDDILLTVQLIDASEDKHLWSDQYNRTLSDVFALQAEVSKKIAAEIKVVIDPDVNNQIEAVPTDNLQSYDAFLRGVELTKDKSETSLDSAVKYFKKAIALDGQFADPYAYVAICYYYKDIFKKEKENLEEMGFYADKALLLNNELPESLIAKGLYYMFLNKYEDAKVYFEKVLEYNPNSAWTHNFLSEIYHRYLPDTEKYLIHALLTLQLDLTQTDSMDLSITHLILSNAFAQSGMMDKAKQHVEISLNYDPENTYSRYLNIFIDVVHYDEKLDQAISRMKVIYNNDTTRLDVLKELAVLYYGNRDYETANHYFTKFTRTKKLYGLNIFPDEDLTIAFVARKVGDTAQARIYRSTFDDFIEGNSTSYKSFLKSMAFLYDGEIEKGLDQLQEFSELDDYMYWLLLINDDPIFSEVKDHPRFISIYQKMRTDFDIRKENRILKLKELGLW